MSTTQFNFIEDKNIEHHFIINNEIRVNEGIRLLENKKIFIHKIIKLYTRKTMDRNKRRYFGNYYCLQ